MPQVIRLSNFRRTQAPRIVWLAGLVAMTSTILMATNLTATPNGAPDAIAQIRSVLREQQDAWNRGDIDGFMNGYARSASTVFISEDTIRRGWETVRDRYTAKYSNRAKMGDSPFPIWKLRCCAPMWLWCLAAGDWNGQRIVRTGGSR